MIELIHGDCIEELEKVQTASIDLVLIDPPYGTVKGLPIHGYRGKEFDRLKIESSGVSTTWDDSLDLDWLFETCQRIIRQNGLMISFGQEPFTNSMIRKGKGNLSFLYRMIWLKDHFANGLIAKKAPVSYFEDIMIFENKYDSAMGNPLRDYSRKVFEYIGKSRKHIFEELGSTSTDHFFRYSSTQFSVCSESTYTQMIERYGIDKVEGFLPYSRIKEIDREYQSKTRKTFNLPEGKKVKSNVFEYKRDYSKLHPTQKPLALIEDLIKTYSNEGDTVLDFTMGSGTTGVACQNLNRSFIGIEKVKEYFEIASNRINEAQPNLFNAQANT